MSSLPITQSSLNKARKDKFKLILTIPNILRELNTGKIREDEYLNLDSLQFSVYRVNVPQIATTYHTMHYAGQNHNITGFDRPPYPPCNVHFAIDNEFKNYWVIWKWLQLLNDPIDSTYGGPEIFKDSGYPDMDPKTLHDYSTDITIIALDEYDNEKASFEFKRAFATKLGDYDYNYRDPEEADCMFEFVFNQLDIHLI